MDLRLTTPDFTLTMVFDSFELAFGRTDTLTRFLDEARDLRDIKPAIDRIDLQAQGAARIRLKISGGPIVWREDYEPSNLEIIDGDMTTWTLIELDAVHLVRDRVLELMQQHGLTDLKYTK